VYPCGHLAPPGRCWWGFNQGPQAFPTRNGYEKLWKLGNKSTTYEYFGV
jgi:hypothetical protein